MLSEHGTQSKPDLPEDVMDYSTGRQIWTALATAHHPMTGEAGLVKLSRQSLRDPA
jgi:hypothetical protein